MQARPCARYCPFSGDPFNGSRVPTLKTPLRFRDSPVKTGYRLGRQDACHLPREPSRMQSIAMAGDPCTAHLLALCVLWSGCQILEALSFCGRFDVVHACSDQCELPTHKSSMMSW